MSAAGGSFWNAVRFLYTFRVLVLCLLSISFSFSRRPFLMQAKIMLCRALHAEQPSIIFVSPRNCITLLKKGDTKMKIRVGSLCNKKGKNVKKHMQHVWAFILPKKKYFFDVFLRISFVSNKRQRYYWWIHLMLLMLSHSLRTVATTISFIALTFLLTLKHERLQKRVHQR